MTRNKMAEESGQRNRIRRAGVYSTIDNNRRSKTIGFASDAQSDDFFHFLHRTAFCRCVCVYSVCAYVCAFVCVCVKKRERARARAGEMNVRFEIQARAYVPERTRARFKVQGSRLKAQGSRLKVQGSRFKVQGSRFKVQGSRFQVPGSGVLQVPLGRDTACVG